MDYITKPSADGKRFAQNNSDILGIEVNIDRRCGCGNSALRIGPGQGIHMGSLTCTECGHHTGWLSREAHAFVSEIVRLFGRPTKPIQVRI